MVKNQQMRWTQWGGALAAQVRTPVLNDDLRPTFERWYPGLKTDIALTQEAAAATGPTSVGPTRRALRACPTKALT
jgi:hypothetical protein